VEEGTKGGRTRLKCHDAWEEGGEISVGAEQREKENEGRGSK